ncbi:MULTISPECIES: serine/threonine-protein kinase [unclassified Nocardioides]|uniref:serine/threonine-protein kinase n=1 Tax=unclassified Nocardioides TaxID=2615069 RepID=UPI0018863AFA|nr:MULTISPECIES: serine/threonine-protein kinase [unclassified Nocardioides]
MIAGRYSLVREIGRGGMGAVWLGRDEVLGREVALKRIGPAPGHDDPEVALERAGREARLAARLNHPHVVAVFDLLGEGEDRWLVMEYVAGSTLSELVRSTGPLSPDQAASLLSQAAEGLAAAHEAGIVHRDVKPSNILVTPDGQVKLTDFGIARGGTDLTLTRTGLVTGSPAYLAPEVASGQPATAACDVWSLGATLFHALAGHPPYDVGDNLLGALYRIVHEEPPRLADAGWLDPLLRGTMAIDPAERWTMSQVRDFLAAGPGAPIPAPSAHTASGPVPRGESTRAVAPVPGRGRAPVAGTRRRGRWVPALLGLAVLALLAVVGVAVLTDRGETPSGGAARGDAATPTASPEPTTPTSDDLRAFVTDYLQRAAADPADGYEMLTPAFQEASGRRAGYDGFWGGVAGVRDIQVTEADPESMTVAYSYTYDLDNGESRTESVRLQLVYDGSRLLVADEG